MLTPKQTSIYSTSQAAAQSLTFVWVCARDEDDIESTCDLYLSAIAEQSQPTNFLVINNGLGERVSSQIVARLRAQDVPASLISFSVKCPESAALTVAFRHTTGDIIVLLPSYPQSDPKDISRMLDAVNDGLDYVASWRTPRIDAKQEQRKSRLFNSVTRWFSGIDLHDINSGLRVMRREVIEDLPLYGDLHVYLPILAARQGYNVGEVPVRHLDERPSPSGGHGFSVYLRRALDLLTLFFLMRFTQKPFRFFGGIGTGLLAIGGLINLVLAIEKIFLGHAIADRPMLVLATLLMVLGVQMFSLGLIGELIIFVDAGGVQDYQIEKVFESNPVDSFHHETKHA